jgi:hypothetical protein
LHELSSSAEDKSSEGLGVVSLLIEEIHPSNGIFTLVSDAEIDFATLRNDEGVVNRPRF